MISSTYEKIKWDVRSLKDGLGQRGKFAEYFAIDKIFEQSLYRPFTLKRICSSTEY